jgi:hypothetical protein
MKKIIGGVITLVIGGTIFTVSKSDIVKNFSKETGLSQQEAQQYVENVKKDDLVPFDKLGTDFVSDGQSVLNIASGIDCVNYQYKWETNTLSCTKGKAQLTMLGNDEIALGKAYTTLASDSASKNDMSSVISLIDSNNTDLSFEIVSNVLDPTTVDGTRKTNSYNKALLQSALESNQ